MNILLLLHLPPPLHGSSFVGKQVLQSRIINLNFNLEFINLLASQKVKDSGHFKIKKIILSLLLIQELIQKLIFKRPRICYFALTTTGLAFYRDVLFVSIIKVFRVPVVFHLHNKGVQPNSNNWIKYRLYRFVFYRSEIILLSELLYQDIEQFVNKEHVHICPNGLSNISFVKVKKEKPIMLFLSNLIQSKGVYDLLEACQLLKTRGIDFQLNIVGSEGDILVKDLNKVIVSYRLEKFVSVLGPLFNEEKIKSLVSASVFVMPTFYPNECFPLVLLEAMQASLPIISTYEGGIPDIVTDGETGYLVPQRDILALADRMEQLILNPELCIKLGAAGRKRYEELFTAEIFENRLLEILQQFSLKYT